MTDILINNKNGQLVTCGHTQCGGYSVIQRLWLVSAFLHLDNEVASKSRTAHTAKPLRVMITDHTNNVVRI